MGASLLVPDGQPAALAFLGQCLRVARALGATVLCGPLYAPVGVRTGAPPTAAGWRAAVQGLRVVALVAEVGSPWLGVHLDTFHLNIEEKSLPGAVRAAGAWLRHVPLAENDRGGRGERASPVGGGAGGAPGGGLPGLAGLRDVQRAGAGEIAAATAVWRPLFPDPWTYARESLACLRQLLPAVGGGR